MAIPITRTHDKNLIKAIQLELWDHLKDDMFIEKATYEPLLGYDRRWYLSWEDGEVFGLYLAERTNLITWEIHTHVRKEFWGSGRTVDHGKAFMDFFWKDTGAKKAVAQIPTSSPQVIGYAKAVGFVEEGINHHSYLKNGTVHDQLYLGITHGITL